MIFRETHLHGVYLLDLERHEDDRGFFARTFAREEFDAVGLASDVTHGSISWNTTAGTIRGMHFQYPPHGEVKLVRCTRGAIHDVIVDLRPESRTFGKSYATRLDGERRTALYVPERFAHGYQVLVAGTEVSYQMSSPYAPEAQGGLRYDDPGLALGWPLPVSLVSARDVQWPLLATIEDDLRLAMASA
jgi:dTDP-4-dehydrorhamnose 3,5-epimerase